jgi:hypothetical protein
MHVRVGGMELICLAVARDQQRAVLWTVIKFRVLYNVYWLGDELFFSEGLCTLKVCYTGIFGV